MLPAKLISQTPHIVPGKLLVTEYLFSVPLVHGYPPSTQRIRLFGRSVSRHEVPLVPEPDANAAKRRQQPWLAFLAGGPGFGHPQPQDGALTKPALDRGYQVLYLDYRGTGLSTPVSADTLQGDDAGEKAEYLRLFRQDSIVRDLEAVRMCLTADYPPEKKKWSIFGQSFGGFVSLTYLSYFPDGLREVFISGGLAPVGRTALEVYEATFQKVVERNQAYYNKFPEDVQAVNRIAHHIHDQGGISLPGGGCLTVPRLLTLGIDFGLHGGLDNVHALVLRLKTDLDQFGKLTRASLVALEQRNPLDTNIIYAILHEAIYCSGSGHASDWAAFKVGKTFDTFRWLSDPLDFSISSEKNPLYFSGEMIFPLHFETYPELIKLKDVAWKLAGFDEWPPLYDEFQLARNEVPVYAASFVEDMNVDAGLARETAGKVKGVRVFETNALYHNAIRAKSVELFNALFQLRDDPVD